MTICQRNVMQEKSRIFDEAAKTAREVPKNYFEELEARLGAIPDSHRIGSPALRLKPYLALAACFTAIMLVGNAVLRSTMTDSPQSDFYNNEFAYVSLLQADEYLSTESDMQDSISDEDVVNYLIDSGTSTELIEYAGLTAQK